MARPARPQSPERHSLVGLQRRAHAGDGGRLRDGSPHVGGGQKARRHAAGDGRDERRDVPARQCLASRGRRRLQLSNQGLRSLPRAPPRSPAHQLRRHVRVHDARRVRLRQGPPRHGVLRRRSRPVGSDPARRLEGHRRSSLHGRRLRVDRLRLPRRADAISLALGGLLLRNHGCVRLSEDGVLLAPGVVDQGPAAHRSRAALELAGVGGAAGEGHGDQQRGDRRPVDQRAIAGGEGRRTRRDRLLASALCARPPRGDRQEGRRRARPRGRGDHRSARAPGALPGSRRARRRRLGRRACHRPGGRRLGPRCAHGQRDGRVRDLGRPDPRRRQRRPELARSRQAIAPQPLQRSRAGHRANARGRFRSAHAPRHGPGARARARRDRRRARTRAAIGSSRPTDAPRHPRGREVECAR